MDTKVNSQSQAVTTEGRRSLAENQDQHSQANPLTRSPVPVLPGAAVILHSCALLETPPYTHTHPAHTPSVAPSI